MERAGFVARRTEEKNMRTQEMLTFKELLAVIRVAWMRRFATLPTPAQLEDLCASVQDLSALRGRCICGSARREPNWRVHVVVAADIAEMIGGGLVRP